MTVGKVIHLLLRLAFGGIFFAFGLSKVGNPMVFLDQVRGYRFFEHASNVTGIGIDAEPIEAWIAMGLPWLEVFCGAVLLLGVFELGALIILNGAVIAFIIGIASAWSRDLEISCGCFANAGPITDYRVEIFKRIIFLAVGIYLLILAFRDRPTKTLADDD